MLSVIAIQLIFLRLNFSSLLFYNVGSQTKGKERGGQKYILLSASTGGGKQPSHDVNAAFLSAGKETSIY